PATAPPAIQRVAIVIAARNEAATIAAKLVNTLKIDPADVSIEVIVASDASDDDTDRIVLDFQAPNVRLVRSPTRLGKEHAQGLAITHTDADLILFTDTGTILAPDVLINILSRLRDDP